MKILAIDPGSTQSAYCLLDNLTIREFAKIENDLMVDLVGDLSDWDVCVIEQITLYKAVDMNVHDTIFWYSKFDTAWNRATGKETVFIPRSAVKKHILPGTSAKDQKDSTVIKALVDRFAPGSTNYGKGTKKEPGFFYGMTADCWQAFALAVTYYDQNVATLAA